MPALPTDLALFKIREVPALRFFVIVVLVFVAEWYVLSLFPGIVTEDRILPFDGTGVKSECTESNDSLLPELLLFFTISNFY